MTKKLLFSAMLMAGATFMLHAQDVIIKENGDEIKAKVTEIGATEVKYKRFGNESGPTYTVSKSELFMIKFANGTKEVFELQAAPAAPAVTVVQPREQTTYSDPAPYVPTDPSTFAKSSRSDDYKRNAFGLDVGIGTTTAADEDEGEITIDLGIRWLHNFNPYIGWDIFKLKANAKDRLNPQLMTGVRGYTPRFGGNMCGYGAFKFGYGIEFYKGAGFCYELELGFHFTQTFFIAFAFNHQGGKGEFDKQVPYQEQYYDWDDRRYKSRTYYVTERVSGDLDLGYAAFRIGFNF